MVPPAVGMVVGDDEVQTLTGIQRPGLAIGRIVEEVRVVSILYKQVVAGILRRAAPAEIEVDEVGLIAILPAVEALRAIRIIDGVGSLVYRVGTHAVGRIQDINVYFVIHTSLIQHNRFGGIGIIGQFVSIFRIQTETDRGEVGLLRQEEDFGTGSLVVVACPILIFARMVDDHRHTEHVTVQLFYGSHVCQIHLREVGHL